MRRSFAIIFFVPIFFKDVNSRYLLIEIDDGTQPEPNPTGPATQQQTNVPDVLTTPAVPPSPGENPRGPYGQRKPKPSKGNSVSTSRAIPTGCFDRRSRNYCRNHATEINCRLNIRVQQNCKLSCGLCDCDRDQFTCTSFIPGRHDGRQRKCIPDYYQCDGDRDCPGGEDEGRRICLNRGCHIDQFQCNNGQCIPSEYLCDGESILGYDCDDRSDEDWRNCRLL